MGKKIFDIIWYIVLFLLLQLVCFIITAFVMMAVRGTGMDGYMKLMEDPYTLVIGSSLSCVATIAIYHWRRYAQLSARWLRTRQWTLLLWVAIMMLGTLLPTEYLYERLGIEMTEEVTRIFAVMMSVQWGYFALAILVPIAEEIVFRGAILRVLLSITGKRFHWVAIVISALIFGAMHGNLAQFVNAALFGLLLGWLYYRTGSIVPTILMHWVNNTMSYITFRLMPNNPDGHLIDFFGGNERTMLLSVVFSLLIFIPALYQVNIRSKSNTQTK